MNTLKHMLRRLLVILDTLHQIKKELEDSIQLYKELRDLLNSGSDDGPDDTEAIGKIQDITAEVSSETAEITQVLA